MDELMTAPANIAFINPQILNWARARSGLSYHQLQTALKTSPEEFASWESGEARPPFDKAQKVARILNIPFGYLYLSKPPDWLAPLPDLRTLEDQRPLSLDFLEVVNDALVKQDWYRDYLQESKETKLKFVGSFSQHDDPIEVAKDLRRVLGINPALRRSARDWADYVSKLAKRAEDTITPVPRSVQRISHSVIE